MLLSQNGSRHQINYLLVILNSFKCRTDGNLRLSVSHIPADQAVHDLGAFHILLGCFYGIQLIFCLFKRKHLFKFFLPYSVWLILISGMLLPCRIEAHQIFGNILYRAPNTGFGFIPLLASQLVQFRNFCVCACVFLQFIQLVWKNIQVSVSGIFNLDVIFCHSVYGDFLNSLIYSQPMIFMDHIIPHRKLCKALDLLSAVFCLFSLFLLFSAKNIRLCNDYKFDQRIFKSPSGIAECCHDLPGSNDSVHVFSIETVKPFFPQILCKTSRPGSGRRKKKNTKTIFLKPF